MLIFSNLRVNAQTYVYIERDETNAELFDENIPYGLMNLLKSNVIDLDYYGLFGMSSEALNRIRSKKMDQSVLNFVGPDNSVIPLKNHLGEDSIASLEDGTLTYVYPGPDSLHVDLDGITGILLDILPKRKCKELHERIYRIYFIKQYAGDERAEIVCSMNGEALFQFDAFKVLTKMDFDESKVLTSDLDDSSMLHYLRTRTIAEMNGQMSGEVRDVVTYNNFNSGRIIVLPGQYWPCSSWNKMNLRHPMTMYDPDFLWHEVMYIENYKCEKYIPFSSFYDDLEGSSVEINDKIVAQFDSCFMLWNQSDVPLIDENGDPIIKVGADGTQNYIYSESEPLYYWVDAGNLEVFTIEDFVYDSILNQTSSKAERLIFTQPTGRDEALKVVFHMDLADNLDVLHFLPESKPIILQEMDWWLQLNSSLKNKKIRYHESKKKEMKKLREKVNLHFVIDYRERK
ncbi:MAG: hypothetical protein ACI837_002129 [Crocinitomicaceae bacterium]|jgi:hypothetical protein